MTRLLTSLPSWFRRFCREIYLVRCICDLRTALLYLLMIGRSFPTVVRRRSLVPADRRMAGTRLRVNVGGGRFIRIDGEYIGIAREIYGRCCYSALPGFSIGCTDCVVDVGANVGIFTVGAAKLGKRVIAVEAQSKLLALIERNALRNGCIEKICTVHGLIGGASGTFANHEARQNASHWGIDPPELTLEDILSEYGLQMIDLLKVDIEGSEFALFNGEADWLSRVRRIVMEVHPDFGDPDAISAILRHVGFHVWLTDNEQRIVESVASKVNGFLYALRIEDECGHVHLTPAR